MIREGVIRDGGEDVVLNEAAVLCDWDLCKYKEQMGKGPRTPVRFVRVSHSFVSASSHKCFSQGTLPFRSAISLVCPMKPYQLSDDVESFIHVFYHLVARFAKTSLSENIGSWVNLFCEPALFVEVDDGRRVQTGGKAKLFFMKNGFPLVEPEKNQTLEALTSELVSLSAEHYRSLDVPDLQTRYAPVVTPQVTKNVPTAPSTMGLRDVQARKRKLEEAGPQPPSRPLLKSAESSPGGSTPATAQSATPPPETTPASSTSAAEVLKPSSDGPVAKLGTHDALLELFYKYGRGVDGSFFEWPDKDLVKTEDQFLAAHLVPSKNNAFSLSAMPGSFPSTAEQQPGPKRRKGMNGSVLESVGETAEEVAE